MNEATQSSPDVRQTPRRTGLCAARNPRCFRYIWRSVLAPYLTGVALAMRSDARTQTSRVALRLAQSRLEAAGISDVLTSGYREGLIAERYRWRQKVTEVRPADERRPPQQGVQPAPAVGAVKSFWVEVAVETPDGSRHETRSAESLCLRRNDESGRTRSSSLSRSSPPGGRTRSDADRIASVARHPRYFDGLSRGRIVHGTTRLRRRS